MTRDFEKDGWRFEKDDREVRIFEWQNASQLSDWHLVATVPKFVFSQAIIGLSEAVGVIVQHEEKEGVA